MADFLDTGKSLYIEGADLGYYNDGQTLWPYLGTSYDADGNSTNNVEWVEGITGTFVDGFACDYPPYGVAEGPDSYVDEFSGTGNGVTVFECQGGKGRVIANYGTTTKGEYYTITSSVMFSYLVEDKAYDDLMEEYIDWLDNASGSSGVETVSLGEIKAIYK